MRERARTEARGAGASDVEMMTMMLWCSARRARGRRRLLGEDVRGAWEVDARETTGRSSLGSWARGERERDANGTTRGGWAHRRGAREAAARDACAEDAECARVDGASAIERYPPNWMKVFAMKWALENEEYGCDRAVWLDPEATFHVDAQIKSCDDDGTCETTRRSVTEIVEDALGNKDFFMPRRAR